AVMLDDSGKKIMEKILVDVPPKYKPASYMDISQTDGAPVLRLAGDVISDEALHGVFIDVLKEMSSPTDMPGAIKEIAQNSLDGDNSEKAGFVCESITYVLYRRFVLDVDVDFIGYGSFLDADTLESIVKLSDDLITAIEGRFSVICKERGLDPMTLTAAVGGNTQPETDAKSLETDTTAEMQKPPPYTKKLRIGTVVGIEFNEFDVIPLLASEASLDEKTDREPITEEAVTETTPATPKPAPPPAKPSEPTEPPILNYPPDTTITVTERNGYGYKRPEILPLRKDRAIALFRRGLTIYALNKDGTEAMARSFSDIRNHDGIFGIAHGAWISTREYISFTSGKPEDRLEAKFIFDNGDYFAVYQTEKDKTPTAYKPYEEIEAKGFDINRHNYSLVYIAPLPLPPSDTPAGLFMWVNAERLEDFNSRALMTSDVLSIKKDEVITSYYANGRTFKELLDFIGEEGRTYRIDDDVEDNIIDDIVVDGAETQKKQEPPPISETSEPNTVTTLTVESDLQVQQQASTAQSPSPSINEVVKSTSDQPPPALPIIKSDAPLYRLSAKDAEAHDALGVYNDSRRMDIDCAEAIKESITKHKKEGNSYDLATPADLLLKRYGKERMMWVLSKHILAAKGFSEANKKWAHDFVHDNKGDNTGSGDDPPAFTINIHHAVLDVFADRIRAAIKKKPSFFERMKAAKKKSEAHNNSSG
ncbi:MAG: DUF3849 domain-containing protein, partial [Defluviitaleaceae bacterium]|nr:DUF3849 domain-containing protein [Defluviitaleaceae bacterium]